MPIPNQGIPGFALDRRSQKSVQILRIKINESHYELEIDLMTKQQAKFPPTLGCLPHSSGQVELLEGCLFLQSHGFLFHQPH